ncbi:MAG TPA: hypothetical protein VMG34_11865 [Bacteroidota bacterium]|nr:hypothetical protein [Bacteroidota bacterium]
MQTREGIYRLSWRLRVLVSLVRGFDAEDRDGGESHDLFGDASKHEMIKPGSPVSGNDDEIDVFGDRIIYDLFVRKPFPHAENQL